MVGEPVAKLSPLGVKSSNNAGCLYFVYTFKACKHLIKPYFCPQQTIVNNCGMCFLKMHYLSILVCFISGGNAGVYTPAFFLYTQ